MESLPDGSSDATIAKRQEMPFEYAETNTLSRGWRTVVFGILLLISACDSPEPRSDEATTTGLAAQELNWLL